VNLVQAARAAAKRHGIDPDVFVAQIRQESGFRTNVGSSAGAKGIAQFMPATAKQYGVNLNDGNPLDDLDGAARYDANLLKQAGGDYKRMLSGYNSGRLDAYKDPNFANGQTYNYVKSILGAAGNPGRQKSGAGSATDEASSPESTTPTSTLAYADTSQQRRALAAQYFANRHDPKAILDLALGLRSLKEQQVNATSADPTAAPMDDPSAPAGGGGGVLHGRKPSNLLELFWQGANGIDVKNGQVQPQGFVSGHTDHVHVAAGPKQMRSLARQARAEDGLHVGENPHFGGVNPVHVKGSYHYKGEAIDVSGDPALEAKFAHLVARKYGIK
jgi:hypothetical protein